MKPRVDLLFVLLGLLMLLIALALVVCGQVERISRGLDQYETEFRTTAMETMP